MLVIRPLTTAKPLTVLKVVVWASFALQGAVYGALAPQLVTLRDSVGFSDSLAGILTGAYTAGMLPGVTSILVLGTRVSARNICLFGLVIIGVSSVCFGIAQNFEVLLTARAAQGFGGGICFAGGTAWLTAAGPASKRGALLGFAWGGMTIGSVLGPAVGSLAGEVGVGWLYGGIGFLFLLFGGVATTIRLKPAATQEIDGDAGNEARRGKLQTPLGLLIAPALAIGILNALVPLLADERHGTNLVTTVAFLGAAVMGGISSPLVGLMADRLGARAVIRIGLMVSGVSALGLALTTNLLALVILSVLYLGMANIFCSVPAVAAASSIGSRRGLASVGAAIAAIFAIFETVGAFIAVPSRELFGELAPFLWLGAVASVSLFFVSRLRVGLRPDSAEAVRLPPLCN